MSDYTSLLYAQPSFWEGMARLIDFGGTLDVYNSSETNEQADNRAIKGDWAAIAEDLNSAIEAVKAKYPELLK